jgi:hypothetical protein
LVEFSRLQRTYIGHEVGAPFTSRLVPEHERDRNREGDGTEREAAVGYVVVAVRAEA